MVFGTEGGLYKYEKSTDKFVADCSLGKQFCDGSRDIFSFTQTCDGKVWIAGLFNKTGEIGVATLNGNTYNWYSKPFKIIPEMMVLAFYI